MPRYRACFEFVSNLNVLVAIDLKLQELKRYLPVTDEADRWLMQVQLATVEIVSNIIVHAYAKRTGVIYCSIMLNCVQLQIDLFDTGDTYQPDASPPHSFNPQDPPEHGYGLEIVRQVMNDVLYEVQPDGSNHWRLVRHLPFDT